MLIHNGKLFSQIDGVAMDNLLGALECYQIGVLE